MSMWYKTIEEYSDRRLNRLPALPGLASLLQPVTEDDYCAGLWKNDLRRVLWCYQPSRGDPPKVMEMCTTNFEELSSKLDTVYFTDHLKAFMELGQSRGNARTGRARKLSSIRWQ